MAGYCTVSWSISIPRLFCSSYSPFVVHVSTHSTRTTIDQTFLIYIIYTTNLAATTTPCWVSFLGSIIVTVSQEPTRCKSTWTWRSISWSGKVVYNEPVTPTDPNLGASTWSNPDRHWSTSQWSVDMLIIQIPCKFTPYFWPLWRGSESVNIPPQV